MGARGLELAARLICAPFVGLGLEGDAVRCAQWWAWKGAVARVGVDDGRV